MRPAEVLIDGVLEEHARRGQRTWAATRTEPFIFERFAARVKRYREKDPAVIATVLNACPPEAMATLARAMAREDALFELAASALPRVPPEMWSSVIGDMLDRSQHADVLAA